MLRSVSVFFLTALVIGGAVPAGAQAVNFRGMPHTALGDATLVLTGTPETGTLLVANIGSTGLDGVSAGLPENACRYSARWDPLPPPAPGGILRFRVYGILDGTPDQLRGTVGFESLGSAQELFVALPAGSGFLNQMRVADGFTSTYNGLITDVGVVATVSRPPDAFHLESACTDVLMTSVTFGWDTPITVAIPGGPTVMGQTIEVMSSAFQSSFSRVEIEMAGLPALNLVDAATGLPGGAADDAIPARPKLATGFPNPFNPRTTLRYELPEAGRIVLAVFDSRGQRITVLRDEIAAAGPATAVWDGTDTRGRRVASGVYFAQLLHQGQRVTRKLVLAK